MNREAVAPHLVKPAADHGTPALGLVCVFLCAAAYASWAWIGYIGSDDYFWYYRGARGWLDTFPFVGDHGTIRYVLTIPMALSILLLGPGLPALLLPGLIYGGALTAMLYLWTARQAGTPAAVLAGLMLVTMPWVAVHWSIANIDIVESCFVIGGILLFHRQTTLARPSVGGLFACGALLGLGFLARETSIFAAAAVALLFLAGYRMPRRHYFIIAAGFLTVWGIETLYLTVMTGDPLYRMHIAAHHDPNLNRARNDEGNLLLHPAIDPLLVLLFNQEFGLFFWGAIPGVVWMCASRRLSPATSAQVRLLGFFALVWLLGVSLLSHSLVLNPRYFLVPGILLTMLYAQAIVEWWRRGAHRLAGAAVLLLLAGSTAGIVVENRDFSFGEFRLRTLARQYPQEVILTDQHTWRRSWPLLSFERIDPRIAAGIPTPGRLFFYNPQRVAEFAREDSAACLRDAAQWQKLDAARPPTRFPFNLLETLGAYEMLPGAIRHKIDARRREYVLYRVAAAVDPATCRIDKGPFDK